MHADCSDPIALAEPGGEFALSLAEGAGSPGRLAAGRLAKVAREELGIAMVVRRGAPAQVMAACPPWPDDALPALRETGVQVTPDGRLADLPAGLAADQGFVAARTRGEAPSLLLAANTPAGVRNALLTLADRLYRDSAGALVADAFDGVHAPAFSERHLKTDAMNCGPFRSRFEYWDPASPAGIAAFADWLASFRITDYALLAFVRGWGTTYPSQRFPSLVDPQHPNPAHAFYPRMIDRLHDWGIRVWASDIYLASGYTMEVGTEPAMHSPCLEPAARPRFLAGEGSFAEILHHEGAVACLSHPAAGRFYADVVADLLECCPGVDGLNFHIGHAFPHKLCRCARCRDLRGNRQAVYRCFARAYEAAAAARPGIRLSAAVKMFGDATREIVDHWEEFPGLEFFCWLRWAGNLLIERVDAPVTLGHEDGGGGLEANHDPKKTLAQIRDYYRDYEPWMRQYVQIASGAGLPSFSWEPALHRELESQFFAYSQLTWEPDLEWAELARRHVIRYERRLDLRLIEAYRLALEANAAVTYWGLAPYETGTAQRVVQNPGLLETAAVRERLSALGETLRALGALDVAPEEPPVAFDLRRSLAKAWQRMSAGQVLGMWH